MIKFPKERAKSKTDTSSLNVAPALPRLAVSGSPFQPLLEDSQMLLQSPDLLPFEPCDLSIPVHVPDEGWPRKTMFQIYVIHHWSIKCHFCDFGQDTDPCVPYDRP